MKKHIIFYSVCIVATALCFSHSGFAQDLEPGDVLPEFTPEQRIERLSTNFTALVFTVIDYAKEQEQSIEEIGGFVGGRFADSWPDDPTPEYYVAAMNNNWQMYAVTTEVLEVGDDYVKASRSRVQFGENLEQAFQNVYGYGIAEFEEFFKYVEKGIASALGLELSQRVEGDYVVFTVSH